MFNIKTVLGISLAAASFNAFAEKQTIDFMFPSPVEGKFTQEMTKVIKHFNESQQDVEVRGIFTGDYDTTKMKAEAAVRAGQAPALVIMSANYTVDLAINDMISPMDELFKYSEDKVSANDFLEKNFWQPMHKNAQYNGVTYAIPFHNSTPIMYYNKKLFQEAGIKEAPKTWAELVDAAKKLTNTEKGQWGIMMPSTNNDYGGWILSALVHANGGQFNNPDYAGEVYYNSPTAKGALQFYKDLVFKHKVMPSGVLNSKQITAGFLSNKVGIVLLSTGSLGFMKENAKDVDFDVAFLPKKVRNAVIIGGASLVTFKGISEEQKKAAYKFLTYLVSPEVNGSWSRFSGYFSPRKASYDTPEMKEYIASYPPAKTALDQLQYAHPWYAMYETVPVRQAMENALAQVVSDEKKSVEDAANEAQKKADELMKPYQDKTALSVE
ncbi:ABC transporter substrate-binding protein [Pelistega indica]|uniref:ABC transporter substrate-binding protein n=1 Tax=Pelistega indica TaxID=1414851 RepID=V8FY58_9BURK|nr:MULTISPECIES: ABC transporter substrate-binding protein [Pelistega]ETD69209.1 ABC transporter substrate-binding protein [Pelistega indica]